MVKRYPKRSFLPFIGCELKVLASKNASLEGITGNILVETRNTFIIASSGKIKVIPKKGSTFLIKMGNSSLVVTGDFLQSRYTKLRKLHRKYY